MTTASITLENAMRLAEKYFPKPPKPGYLQLEAPDVTLKRLSPFEDGEQLLRDMDDFATRMNGQVHRRSNFKNQ